MARWGGLALAALLAAAVLWAYHDRFWYPPDEGAYAHVAARLLAGEVLNRDVQDIHLGYVNFANAAALWAFGERLVSLRYPLAALTLAQACIVYLLLAPAGLLTALAGAAAMATLTFVQFLNPTAHWYALALAVAAAAALAWWPANVRGRLFALGYLVVTLFMFRQLTGVFVAAGVVAWLLCERPGTGPRWAARALLALLAAVLAAYLLAKADAASFVLFGLWPLAALGWCVAQGGAANREVLRIVLGLAAGGAAALAPLLAYHLLHGSVAAWIDDTVFAGFRLTGLGFIRTPGYTYLLLLAGREVLTLHAVASGLMWLALASLPVLAGALLLATLRREGRAHPLAFLAVFYALTSVHYQIPIYLLYGSALSLVAVLLLAPRGRLLPAAAIALCTYALYAQAAQPLSRGLGGIVEGRRAGEPLAEISGLRVPAGEAALHGALLAAIARESAADESILALPANPELYFLSGRQSPVRFYNASLGLADAQDAEALLARLAAAPPRLIVYRLGDKYDGPGSRAIMEWAATRYEALPPVGEFALYRLPRRAADSAAAASPPRTSAPDTGR